MLSSVLYSIEKSLISWVISRRTVIKNKAAKQSGTVIRNRMPGRGTVIRPDRPVIVSDKTVTVMARVTLKMMNINFRHNFINYTLF